MAPTKKMTDGPATDIEKVPGVGTPTCDSTAATIYILEIAI